MSKCARIIKTLAVVTGCIGIIGTIVTSIIFIVNVSGVIGTILLIAGLFMFVFATLFAYGFGELIEKATKIEENTRNAVKSSHFTIEIDELIDKATEIERNTRNGDITFKKTDCAPKPAMMPTVQKAEEKKNIELKPLSKDCEINKTYSFGEYWQESSAENMKTAIEWIVLDKKDNKALVISRFALDVQPFSEDPQATTWGNCSLRAWLNSTFVKNAFSEKEQAKIEMTTVSLDKNPKIDASSESDTKDRIFLLSTTEIKKYLLASNRQCFASSYAQKHGAYANPSNGFCWWWLRTSGDDQDRAMIVISNDGSINDHGNYVYNKNGAVRPAMWINLSE